MLNGEERESVSERTINRLGDEAVLERQKQFNKDLKPENINCTLSPRPAICDDTGGTALSSGE